MDVQPFPKARQRAPRGLRAKPKPLTLEAIQLRARVAERSRGRCEVQSPWCEGRATQVHHICRRRVPEADWNVLATCGNGNVSGCHGYLHQHPEESYARGWLIRTGQEAAALDALRDAQHTNATEER